MKFKSTYIVGFIFISIFAYVYFYEILGEPARRRAEEEKNRIYHFEKDKVNRIKIARSDTIMVFVRQDEGWMISSPVYYKGDDTNIETLLGLFHKADNESVVSEDSENPEVFGLGAGAPEVTMTLSGGTELSLIVGDLNPTESSVYAKISGSPRILMTSSQLRMRVNEPLLFFRDKTILEFNKDNINKIIFHQKGEEYSVEKVSEAEWRLKKPFDYLANGARIDRILNRMSYYKIAGFADDSPVDLQPYGLKNKDYWVMFVDEKENDQGTLFIGKEVNGNYYMLDESRKPVFEVDSITVAMLLSNSFDLRDRKVVYYDKETIDSLKITYEDSSYVFQREGSKNSWIMTMPEKQKARANKIVDIIDGIYWTRVEAFIDNMRKDLKLYGLDPPVADFVLYSNGEEVEHVQLGKEADNKRYFYNITLGQLFMVRPGLYPVIVVDRNELVEVKH